MADDNFAPFTVADIAAALGVSEWTVRKKCRSREFDCYRVGRRNAGREDRRRIVFTPAQFEKIVADYAHLELMTAEVAQ